MIYGESSESFGGVCGWGGVVIVLLGVILMETKPKLKWLDSLGFDEEWLQVGEDVPLVEIEMGSSNKEYQE
eukprot:13684798-Ditylum_brightwellii.AAC.1